MKRIFLRWFVSELLTLMLWVFFHDCIRHRVLKVLMARAYIALPMLNLQTHA